MRISASQAIELIQQEQVVSLPTETVYGLAASLSSLTAIEAIFILKGRPRSNPLIIHVADVSQIQYYITECPPNFEKLAEAFWPGPLTLILPIVTDRIPTAVRADLKTAAFRIPNHPLTREVLRATGPLVMPSANLSGKPSATSPLHVEADFGEGFPVLEGGECIKGLESTILHYQEGHWIILRLGSLEPEIFQSTLGYQPQIYTTPPNGTTKPLCPGQLFRHYAPKAKLILGDLTQLEAAPFILGFKERSYPAEKRILSMGSLNDPEEVAENFYKNLRQLDLENAAIAWVDMDFPRQGLWLTIAERLERAGNGGNFN